MRNLIDTLQYIGAVKKVTLESIICSSVKGNAISVLRGMAVEEHFKESVKEIGAVFKKVDDTDINSRYDFDVQRRSTRLRFECKMGQKNKKSFSVSIAFKDNRIVTLPSGTMWNTHARNRNEDFDYLAINLVNITGEWGDFIYVHKDHFPSYNCEREEEYLIKSDRDWISKNYWSPTVNISDMSKYPSSLASIL